MLPEDVLSDGAFRLHCVVLAAARDDDPREPGRGPCAEVDFEECATLLGRSARTIGRFAEDLLRTGLWEQVDRTRRPAATVEDVGSDPRARTRTVLTVRVYDAPAASRDADAGDRPDRPDSIDTAARDHPGAHPEPAHPDSGVDPDDRLTAVPDPDEAASLAEELAMFRPEAVDLVARLCARARALPHARPLGPEERVGLARRIDAHLTQGWSLTRVRAVLCRGRLDGIRLPGPLWIARLDEMPAYRHYTTEAARPDAPPAPARPDPRGPRPSPQPGRYRPAAAPRRGHVHVHDCSNLPDPNPGRARYEIPDTHRRRMTAVWADDRTVPPWCGRCSGDSRCLSPATPGGLLRPCPVCHPDPAAFPQPPEQTTADAPPCDEGDTRPTSQRKDPRS